MDANFHSRLDALDPRIKQLMKLGGTPGLSVSVVTPGQPTYHSNYGFRDLLTCQPITEDTLFSVASLAKTVSAAALAILVDRKAISWDTPIKDIIPSFRSRNEHLQEHTTLEQILSHISGMSSCGNLVMGSEANVLIARDDRMRIVNEQILLPDRLGTFSYNSTAWELCDEIIEHVSGHTTHEFVKENIFDPLGMGRSYMKPPPQHVDNVATCYNALDDGSAYPVPSPKLGHNGIGSSSGGLISCASDLVKLYTAFGEGHRSDNPLTASSSVLRQVKRLMSAKVPLNTAVGDSVCYGLGWVRVKLPNSLGQIGLNGRLIPERMPVIAERTTGQDLLYHQGTLPGVLATIMLLPEIQTQILVLSNCLALTDVPDWVSQMLLEEVLNVPTSYRVNFVEYAKLSIAKNLGWYGIVSKLLADERASNAGLPPNLDDYTGRYVDATGVFTNVVTLKCGRLYWAFQGLRSETFELKHYHGDIFTWLRPRNELSRRGRWVLGDATDVSFWKADFRRNASGQVEKLLWAYDSALEPIVYVKTTATNILHESV